MGALEERPIRSYLPIPQHVYGVTPGSRITGLNNLGNTCYFNSVVQLLYHLDAFRSELNKWERVVNAACSASGKQSVTVAPISVSLSMLFNSMEPCGDASGKDWKVKVPVVTPKSFLRVAQRAFPQFADQSCQHDAHELLIAMLNGIEEEIRATEKNLGLERENQTLVKNLFGGALVFETQCCGCDAISFREEPFFVVDIDIPSASSKACLKDLLDRLQHREVLSGDEKFFCDSCRCLQEATRRVVIDQIPQVLVIQLKRFHCDYSKGRLLKTNSQVLFPLELDFKTVDSMLVYELVGCVVHIGKSINSGHYVSVCKTNAQWFLFNDDYILPVDESWLRKVYGGRVVVQEGGKEKVFNSHAYLLAYVRRDSSKLHTEDGKKTEKNESQPSTKEPTELGRTEPSEDESNKEEIRECTTIPQDDHLKEDDEKVDSKAIKKSDGRIHSFRFQ